MQQQQQQQQQLRIDATYTARRRKNQGRAIVILVQGVERVDAAALRDLVRLLAQVWGANSCEVLTSLGGDAELALRELVWPVGFVDLGALALPLLPDCSLLC